MQVFAFYLQLGELALTVRRSSPFGPIFLSMEHYIICMDFQRNGPLTHHFTLNSGANVTLESS